MQSLIPTAKQSEYIRHMEHHNARWNFKEGAVRSGKTFLDIFYTIPVRIRRASDEGRIFLIGNTKNSIETNVLEPMRNLYGEALVGRVNQQTGRTRLFGKDCYVLGADKKSSVGRIHGATLSYCYGDEVATWAEQVFNEVKSRLNVEGACFDGTCNPEGPEHWLLKFLESDADVYRQKYLLEDNKANLDPVYFREIQNEYKGTVYFDRYILGKWALAEGRVYAAYDPVRDPIDKVPEALTGDRVVSCDYGIENPHIYILWEQGESGTWYATDGWSYSGRANKHAKTDSILVKDLINFLDGRKIRSIIVDPSASSFIAALRYEGFRVIPAKNDVKPGIMLTADKLNKGEVKILKSLQGLLNELSGYSWDESARLRGEEKPVKVNDHWCDAMRYFVYTVLRPKRSGVFAL